MAKKTRGARTSYPTDVTDEEWDFCAPYLTLMREDAPQRDHSLRLIFNAVRYVVRTGCAWRMLPNDLPPWYRCINSPNAGPALAVLKRWRMIFASCCAL